MLLGVREYALRSTQGAQERSLHQMGEQVAKPSSHDPFRARPEGFKWPQSGYIGVLSAPANGQGQKLAQSVPCPCTPQDGRVPKLAG